MGNGYRFAAVVAALVFLALLLDLRAVLQRECLDLGGQPDGAMCWFGDARPSVD